MILLFYDCGYDLRRDSLIRFTLNVILIFVKSELLEEPAISFVNLSVRKTAQAGGLLTGPPGLKTFLLENLYSSSDFFNILRASSFGAILTCLV